MSEALVIFARTPRAGHVKTRLTPHLSAEDAAKLYEAFILDTATTVGKAAPSTMAGARVARWYIDGPQESFPKAIPGPVYEQRGKDLGDRMLRACLETVEAGYSRIVIIGTDSPTLPPAFIDEAFRTLDEDGGMVLGPSLDGGYYLIGLAKMVPSVFRDMAWSTPGVFEETCRRVAAAGVPLSILPEWYDVDVPADLVRLRADLAEGGTAPFTSEILCNLTI